MATILYTDLVCDGYDVRVRLLDGRDHLFHFSTTPDDMQVAIDSAEIDLMTSEIEFKERLSNG